MTVWILDRARSRRAGKRVDPALPVVEASLHVEVGSLGSAVSSPAHQLPNDSARGMLEAVRAVLHPLYSPGAIGTFVRSRWVQRR